MGISETDVSSFVASLAKSDSVEASPEIREAVFDQLEYDLGLTLYRFERRHIRNSELLQLIKAVAGTNRFSAATYVREAIIADSDRKVTEDLLRKLSERTSHREWYGGPVEERPADEHSANSAYAHNGRSIRADIELLAVQH
ncbi:hypothetical protein [Methanomassiliicoccus luminyensis]|uniref:hypothetical protein n=1 Tax=Methanomassiliicoccus luminyensis TaxID=1080712 RepID=UPI000376D0F6|nr:hypothetical protein [Methanomassiliicoccus luminyensis]